MNKTIKKGKSKKNKTQKKRVQRGGDIRDNLIDKIRRYIQLYYNRPLKNIEDVVKKLGSDKAENIKLMQDQIKKNKKIKELKE